MTVITCDLGIKINAIRDSNAEGRRLGKLVVIFVGGTGGIGRSTAKELFLRTRNPRAYIVGRQVDFRRSLGCKVWLMNSTETTSEVRN